MKFENIHEVLGEVLKNKSSDFTVAQYYLQAFGYIERKIYKPFVQQTRKKIPGNLCRIFFGNKGVKFINISRVLIDPDITLSLLNTSVKFTIPMVTYKLGLL